LAFERAKVDQTRAKRIKMGKADGAYEAKRAAAAMGSSLCERCAVAHIVQSVIVALARLEVELARRCQGHRRRHKVRMERELGEGGREMELERTGR
jgi:hypothetical protein